MADKKHHHTTKNNNNVMHIVLIVLLVINLLLTGGLYMQKDALWLEKLRVGGEENFNVVQKLYKSDAYKEQQNQAINQIINALGGQDAIDGIDDTLDVEGATENNTEADSNDNEPTAAANSNYETIDVSVIEGIKADGYLKGDENARITLIEYSDLECPYCQRHFNNGTVDEVLSNYPDDVNKVYRHFPLRNIHPQAQQAAEAMECAGELGGVDAYYDFMAAAFTAGDLGESTLIAIATDDIGLNESSFTSCLDSGKYTSVVDAQLQEGQELFGVRGTPGNVLVDNETGRYVVIAGAYPYDKFAEEIDALLAE